MSPTPTYLLLEAKLGEPLAPLVERMRADDRSYAYIARKLRERTKVKFSDEAFRLWFSDQPADTQAGAA